MGNKSKKINIYTNKGAIPTILKPYGSTDKPQIMTLNELKKRVEIERGNTYGWYKVTVTYRGMKYCFSNNNTEAVDRIKSDATERTIEHGFTLKQAYEYFYYRFIMYYERGDFN